MNKKIFQILSIIIAFTVIGIVASCKSYRNTSGKPAIKEASKQQAIMVFAGAGLTGVLSEIADSFELNYKVEVKTNMASSGTLARQIEQGIIPDVYISASRRWANYVDSLGYIQKGYKSAVAKSDLVLVAPLNSGVEVSVIDSTVNFLELLKSGRLSMGDPAHVPAGKYAKQSLEYYGWFDKLDDKKLPAKDVRSALMVVEMGEAPLGIVYKPDALKSKKIEILNTFPEKTHQPIEFIAGVCKDNKATRDFYTYLNSDATKDIWIKHGFRK